MDPEPNSGLVFRWTRSTFFGWTAGFALVLAFVAVAGAIGLGDAQFPVGLGMGTGVGWLQARARLLPAVRSRAWVASSAFGMGAPFLLFDVTRWLRRGSLEYSLPVSVAIGGLLVGILQSRLLRGDSRRAPRWILSSAIGWSLAGATALNNLLMPQIPGLIGALTYVVVVLLGGVVLGCIQGVTLRAISRMQTVEALPTRQ